MMDCFKSNDCELKEVLEMLCCAKKIECKQGSFQEIMSFAKEKKAKSAILLIKGNVIREEAQQFAFVIEECTKTKKLIWAVNRDKKLKFKLLLAF